jgi:signal transduction histidine kinase
LQVTANAKASQNDQTTSFIKKRDPKIIPAIVRIQDNGPGVAENVLSKIFDII